MLILTIILLCATIKAQDIEWFRNTPHHKQNIIHLEKGWDECPDWNILSIKQQISFEGVEQIQLPKHNNTIYNITASCIILQVPLNWDNTNPNDIEIIDYHITRTYSGFNEDNLQNNGAVWILQGGPGLSGESLYSFVIPTMNFMDNKFDLYFPDQRGTGYSSYLSAEDFNDTEYIKYFSSYSHTMDLGYAIDLFQNEYSHIYNNNDIVYGISYGTYYLNQYLILFPEQVNAAIFDGVVDPKRKRWSNWDRDVNEVGLLFFDRCQNDEFCKGKFDELNTTIFDATRYIIDQLEGKIAASECVKESSSGSSAGFKQYLSEKLASSIYRIDIAWTIYRLYQCDERNIEWAEGMGKVFDPQSNVASASSALTDGVDVTATNNYLSYFIVCSELWEMNSSHVVPSYLNLSLAEEQYLITTGASVTYKQQCDAWKDAGYLYEPNPIVYNKYANPQIPVLILNGDLDPQTHHKYALNLANEYGANIDDVDTVNNKQIYFVTMPNIAHAVLLTSYIRNFTDNTGLINHDFETCALYIIKSFLNPNNNYYKPNIDCIKWLIGADFEATYYNAIAHADLWGTQSSQQGNDTSIAATSNNEYDSESDDETRLQQSLSAYINWLESDIGIIFSLIIMCLLIISISIISCLSCCLCSKEREIKDIQLQINEDSV